MMLDDSRNRRSCRKHNTQIHIHKHTQTHTLTHSHTHTYIRTGIPVWGLLSSLERTQCHSRRQNSKRSVLHVCLPIHLPLPTLPPPPYLPDISISTYQRWKISGTIFRIDSATYHYFSYINSSFSFQFAGHSSHVMNVRWSVGDDRGLLLNFLLNPANVLTRFSFISFMT
jgi:hypothetical protein